MAEYPRTLTVDGWEIIRTGTQTFRSPGHAASFLAPSWLLDYIEDRMSASAGPADEVPVARPTFPVEAFAMTEGETIVDAAYRMAKADTSGELATVYRLPVGGGTE